MVVDEEDGWVVASLSDASMAAEILLQLRRSRAPTRLDWTDRRHSRTTVATHEDEQKEEEHGGGASPSTPLSWSGASSLSCGADRESSRAGEVEPTSMSRSQVRLSRPSIHISFRFMNTHIYIYIITILGIYVTNNATLATK